MGNLGQDQNFMEERWYQSRNLECYLIWFIVGFISIIIPMTMFDVSSLERRRTCSLLQGGARSMRNVSR